ncbi:MAG: phosphopentomutase [Spirochaetales bacterium]|nr:phosphopentomutase [Spirochaetales bacterium]
MTIICLVIDSFGIGEAPDADEYGDAGSNTAVHIGEAVGGVCWPYLQAMGLGNISGLLGNSIPGCPAAQNPRASFAALRELSKGKDTTTGHWELAGITLEKAFTTFPKEYPSFPQDLTARFENLTGRGVLGNIAASGTQIIQELGDEHCRTGFPIVYTSSDSVFQIAAHEDIIPVAELYRYCEIARKLCDEYNIGRVIARPFEGDSGDYRRTVRRHDYSIALPGPSLLDHLRDNSVNTIGVGKIGDIFNSQGLDESYPDKGNKACLERTRGLLGGKTKQDRFIFVNLVDTDMIYGHRRDAQGYHDSVAETDAALPGLEALMEADDAILISADHGCDPTYSGTDHTREYVPFLCLEKKGQVRDSGIQQGFHFLSHKVCDVFGISRFP